MEAEMISQLPLMGAPTDNAEGFESGRLQLSHLIANQTLKPTLSLDRYGDVLTLTFRANRPGISYFGPDEDFLMRLDSATGELLAVELSHFHRASKKHPELRKLARLSAGRNIFPRPSQLKAGDLERFERLLPACC